MAFQFGLIDNMDPTLSLLCFIGVIAFIIFFEYVTGVLEFFLEESPLYNQMVQSIYKELMLMGLISFIIIMYEASQTSVSVAAHEAIVAIDFAHIILFYVTMFFVIHAFFLIKTSLSTAVIYRRLFAESTDKIIAAVEEAYQSRISKFLFQLKYLPLSAVRDRVEFNVIHTIFQATYCLPENFDFAEYLSNSYARYSLKLIHRSLFTWAMLIISVIINFIRIRAGYSCHIVTLGASGGHRRLGSATTDDHAAATDDHHTTDDHHATDDHGALAYLEHRNELCHIWTLQLFLIGGACLILYTFFLVYFSRLYKIRLIQYAGVKGPEEAMEFLRYKSKRMNEPHNVQPGEQRYTLESLKSEIEQEMHSNEFVEDEEGFRFIGQLIIAASRWLDEITAQLRLKVKLALTAFFCPGRLANKGDDGKGDMLKGGRRLRTKSTEVVEPSAAGTNAGNGGARQRRASGVPVERKKRDSIVAQTAVPVVEKVPLRHRLSSKHQRKMSAAVSATPSVSKDMDELRKKHAQRKAQQEAEGSSILKEHEDEDDDDDDAKTRDGDEVQHFDEESGFVSRNIMSVNTSVKAGEEKTKDDDVRGPATVDTKPTVDSTTGSVAGQLRDGSNSDIELMNEPACVIEGYRAYRARKLSKLGLSDSYLKNDSTDWVSCSCFFSKVAPHSDTSTPGHENPHALMRTPHDIIDHKGEVEHEFNSIFLFGQPIYYFRAVELCIMFNCFYMAIWSTNMISITTIVHYSEFSDGASQFVMLLPFLIGFVSLQFIAQTASILTAVSELNVEVVHDVLKEMQETDHLVKELRAKIISRTLGADGQQFTDAQRTQFISELFAEIDVDGSGCIDKDEFRSLLRNLKLTYSDDRFKLLFRALDGADGNGQIEEESLQEFLFPGSVRIYPDEPAEEMYELPPV